MSRGFRIDPVEDVVDWELVENAIGGALDHFGSQRALARAAGINEAFLSLIIARKRHPSDKLLDFLKLGKYTVRGYYELSPEELAKLNVIPAGGDHG